MPTCTNSCSTSPRSNIRFGSIIKPSSIMHGDLFSITIPVINTNFLQGAIYEIGLENAITSECLDVSSNNQIYAGKEKPHTFSNIQMPLTGDLRLKLSLSWLDWSATYVCEDSISIIVTGTDPNSSHLACIDSICQSVPGTGSNLNGCTISGDSCGGSLPCSEINCPSAKNYCIPGINMCVPKADALIIAGVIVAFMMLKKN